MNSIRVSTSQRKGLRKLKSPKGLALFTYTGIFFTYKSQTNDSKGNTQLFFIGFRNNPPRKMKVDLNELVNSYEVVPVSLSDPFKSLVAEPSTMEVLRFIPIIAFIALIITAVWRQGKKFPVRAIGDSSKDSKQD